MRHQSRRLRPEGEGHLLVERDDLGDERPAAPGAAARALSGRVVGGPVLQEGVGVSGRRPRRPADAQPKSPMDAKAARVAAFDLLARKAWSARELTSRLTRRGAPADIARAVVAELESQGYVNDAGFAGWWPSARRAGAVGSVRLARFAPAASRALAAVAVARPSTRSETSGRPGGAPAAPAVAPRPDRAASGRDYLLRRGSAVALLAVTRLLGRADESSPGTSPAQRSTSGGRDRDR